MVVAQTMDEPTLKQHSFSFRGDGGTYLLICIRTFLLAIITLGIYSAWGTVERRRYMMGNTVVAGHGFDYHVRPITLLIGRIIGLALLIGINFVAAVSPEAALVVAIAFMIAIPWLVNRVLAFHLRNSSYRNVRFDFRGSYWRCLLVAVIYPLTIFLTLGLTYPWVQARYQEYIMNRLKYGKAAFTLQLPLWPLYKAFGKMILVYIPVILLFSGLFYLVNPQDFLNNQGMVTEEGMQSFFQFYAVMLLFMAAATAVLYIFAAAFRNEIFNNLSLEGGHRFSSNVTAKDYAWVVVSRGFLATITGGILIPWAEVEIHTYLMNNTTLWVNGDMDGFFAHGEDGGGAAAAEFGAFEGVADGVLGGI